MRVRIVCKAPENQPGPCRTQPSGYDTRVLLIAEDGSETEIPGVVKVTWRVGVGELAVATLDMSGVEIDAQATVEKS